MKRRRSPGPSPLDEPDPRYPEPGDGPGDGSGDTAHRRAVRGGLGVRFTARIVDVVLIQIVITPVVSLANGAAAFVVLSAVYEVATTARWGQTGGKWLVGLRVVDVRTGSPPSVLAASIRWALLLYWLPVGDALIDWLHLSWIVAVVVVVALGRRGPHELLSRTVVWRVAPGRIRRGGGR